MDRFINADAYASTGQGILGNTTLAALTMGYDELRRLGTVSNGVFTSIYSYCDDAATGKAFPWRKVNG